MNANLYAAFRSRFPSDESRPLLTDEGGRTISYAEALSRIARLVGALAAIGLKPGDRVTVQTEKSPDSLFLYLACLAGGFVYQPLNTAYKPDEIAYFLCDAEPALMVCRPGDVAHLAVLAKAAAGPQVLTLERTGAESLILRADATKPIAEILPRRAEDLAVLLYSSGTTGRPKGAMLTHGNLLSNAVALVEAWGFRPDDRLLHALPLFHAHGLLVGVSCALLASATMRFLPRFDARIVAGLMAQATVFMGVPTYYTRLLAEPGFGRDACRKMRLFVSGSAPLLPETFERFRMHTGHTILERYGLSETLMNTSNLLHGERIAGAVGYALPGIAIRIADADGSALPPDTVGEIQVKGPNVFAGYWRNPQKTADSFTADGWFRTGDLGLSDRSGLITIVGRAKDLIISGGLNVYPKEVEECIDRLHGVAESAVVGIPDADFGEAVAAAAVLKPGGDRPDAAAVIRHVKTHLADFKVPKQVRFLDELPRNAMGKVEKARVRALFAEE